MKTIEQMARHLVLASKVPRTTFIGAGKMSEMYVEALPVSVIKDMYIWLSSNKQLKESELDFAIKTFIVIGEDKGKELEIEFPDFKGLNPIYSFRLFKINFTKVASNEGEKSCYEVTLIELGKNKTQSNEISNVSPTILDILLKEVITDEVSKTHSLLRRIGVTPTTKSVPKSEIILSVTTEEVEQAFLLYENRVKAELPRPDYLQLVHIAPDDNLKGIMIKLTKSTSRKFKLKIETVDAHLPHHLGWRELTFTELDSEGEPSNDIDDINGNVIDALVHEIITDDIMKTHEIFKGMGRLGSIIGLEESLPKTDIVITANYSGIEKAFLYVENHCRIKLGRPSYLQLHHITTSV